MFFSKTFPFRLLSSNGIIWILAFLILRVTFKENTLQFKISAVNSVSVLYILSLKELNLSRHFDLVWATWGSTSSNMTSKIQLIFYATGHESESTTHFLLHCLLYIYERRTLLITITNLDYNLLQNRD